jgi:hypothetical protein
MAEISPLRRRMIEDMTVRNLSPGDATILPSRGIEVEPVFRSVPRLSRPGGYPRLPGTFGGDRDILACAESDRLCAAFFLRCDARPRRHSGAHQLRTRAEQAAGRAEHRRGRALSGGNSKPQEPHRADNSLCPNENEFPSRDPAHHPDRAANPELSGWEWSLQNDDSTLFCLRRTSSACCDLPST